jgi:hypothetical protein
VCEDVSEYFGDDSNEWFVRKIVFAISGITNCIRPDRVSSGCLIEPYQTEYGSKFYHQA